MIDQDTLFAGIDATWPPLKTHNISGWAIREGAGGGKRVSSASKIGDCTRIEVAEDALSKFGQNLLFQIRGEDALLDAQLAQLGYEIIDPVVLLAAPIDIVSQVDDAQHLSAADKNMKSIWAEGGITDARIAVMDRVTLPKAYSKLNGAVAFSAIYEGICFTHAVEVAKASRRQGLGRRLMQSIAKWAAEQNAEQLSVLTVRENMPALTLYENLGLQETGQYHYRIKR